MRTVYAVDITVYDPAMYGTKTLHFATHGIIYGGHYYEPRLKQPGNFQMNLWGDGTTRGASRVGFGEIVLINNDGGLDSFANYGLDGRSIVLRKIVLGVATILMSCSMEQPVPTWDTVPIRIKDKQQLLTVPVQPTKYAGTNALPAGVEGTADIQGRPKPLLYGVVFNTTPVCVNTSRLIYQCHESALQDIPSVYDKGVSLTRGTDYVSAAEVQSSPPDPGTFRAYLAGGMFRLGSSPAGQVTFDGVEGATAADRTAAQIANRLALRGITGDEIDADDVTALDALNSAEVGIYISGEQSIAAGIDEVLGSIGAWYAFDSLGVLNMGRLDAPAGEPVATLTSAEILSIDRKATNDSGRGVPPYRVNLGYAKNYTVQDSDLAGILSNFGWVPHILSSDATIQAIAHGNGVMVAIGLASAKVFRSVDNGNTWTEYALPNSSNIQHLAYGNGIFVAVSSSGAYYFTSTDGATWTRRSLPSSASWGATTFGGGVFVVIGYDSDVALTSADGVTWTPGTMPSVGYWRKIAFGGGAYVAVCDNAAVSATSADGITWVARTLPTDLLEWGGLAYGNGVFVLVPMSSSATTYNSFDGITWLTCTGPVALDWAAMAHGDGAFLALPGDTGLSGTTTDGTSWVYYPVQVSGKWTGISGITYANGSFIAAAYVGTKSIIYTLDMRPTLETRTGKSKEYRTKTSTDGSVLTKHPTAGELNINTLLAYAADATAEADRQLALRGVDRDYLSVKVKSAVLPADILGKTVMIRVSRYGYDIGKLFTVVGATYDYALNSTVIEIWG